MPLLAHVMEFDTKLGMYLGDTNKDMTDKAGENRTRIQAMVTASDMAPDTHLRLTLFLLDQLPVISLGLSFGTRTQGHYLPEKGHHLPLYSSSTG